VGRAPAELTWLLLAVGGVLPVPQQRPDLESAMAAIVDLPIEDLTPEAFAEFGEVLAPRARPTFDLPGKDLHRFAWHANSPTIMQVICFKPQPLSVTAIERHGHVTEARMHIGGPAAVVVVGAPSDAPPNPSTLRAFRIDRQGIMFKRGTWHGIDAYPLGAEPSQFLHLSDRDTQRELFDEPVDHPTLSTIHRFATADWDIRLTGHGIPDKGAPQ